jgi:hypothetical protein
LLRKDKISTRGAPSLLTPAQQAEAERNRILSTLEETDGGRKRASKPASPDTAGRGTRAPWMWGMSALLLAAVAGGAGLWYGQQAAQAPVVVAATAQPEPVLAPVVAGAAEAAPAPVEAATIQEDAQVHGAAVGGQSLSEMLDAAPASAAEVQPTTAAHAAASGAGTNMLSQALEAPSGAALAAVAAAPVAVKVAQTSSSASASKAAPRTAPTKAKPVVKKVVKRPAQPAAAPDNDALLLSALIAHSQAAEPASKKARPSLERELGNCRKLAKGQQQACRERACEGRTAGLCKVSK